MKHLDLFSGIGGFAIAVDEVFPGSEHIFCDNDKFCQAVLKKHWPQSKIYGDIRQLTSDTGSKKPFGISEQPRQESIKNWKCDILTGGFPCQPFSQAGKRKGTDDDRYLWPEMLRVIREFKPTFVIAENVRGLLTLQQGVVFEQVCLDLEASGYEVQPLVIPAVAVNAPHRRDRVWFIANRKDERSGGCASQECGIQERKLVEEKSERSAVRSESQGCAGQSNVANSEVKRGQCRESRESRESSQLQEKLSGRNDSGEWDKNWIEVASELCSVDDGLQVELGGIKLTKAGNRNSQLKAYGNAIVPQVAIEILKAIRVNY